MTGSTADTVICGFIPLTDCATLVAAREMGFAAEEGVNIVLQRETSWSNIRDKLALGLFDAAHMLAPMPIAMSAGLSSFPAPISAPFILSVNGNVIGVSLKLAQRISEITGKGAFFSDAAEAAKALREACGGRVLRVGAPWTFSMHTILLDYWLGRCGFNLTRDINVSIVPPPLMANALAADEIDIFCVGEPWGSIAVEKGVGALMMSQSSIWSFAPEKALGVGRALEQNRPETLDAFLRALYRAAQWAAQPQHRAALVEILARPEYLEAPVEVVERALRGSFIVAPQGELRTINRALELFDCCATFPWRSQASWIATELAARHGLSPADLSDAADVFRPDVYRRALSQHTHSLPLASSKIEGSLKSGTDLSSMSGTISLGPDDFFDGAVFDPNPHASG